MLIAMALRFFTPIIQAMQIKLVSKSQRATNRINEHGDIFQLVRSAGNRILVRSLHKTWREEKWFGWFTTEEALWTEV